MERCGLTCYVLFLEQWNLTASSSVWAGVQGWAPLYWPSWDSPAFGSSLPAACSTSTPVFWLPLGSVPDQADLIAGSADLVGCWFLIDIISCLPYHLLLSSSPTHSILIHTFPAWISHLELLFLHSPTPARIKAWSTGHSYKEKWLVTKLSTITCHLIFTIHSSF